MRPSRCTQAQAQAKAASEEVTGAFLEELLESEEEEGQPQAEAAPQQEQELEPESRGLEDVAREQQQADIDTMTKVRPQNHSTTSNELELAVKSMHA